MSKQTPPIQVTAAIIKHKGQILIARRAPGKHLAGYWEFPGGKIEAGETAEACLGRELHEELGIQVQVGSFFMENLHHYGDKPVLLKAYFCDFKAGTIRLNDHDQYAWVSKDELGNYRFAPADLPFIFALNESQ